MPPGNEALQDLLDTATGTLLSRRRFGQGLRHVLLGAGLAPAAAGPTARTRRPPLQAPVSQRGPGLVGLRTMRNHTPHDRAVREREDAFEASVHDGEVPHTRRNPTYGFEAQVGDGAAQVSHRHGVPAGDATAPERQAAPAGGVDLIQHVFFVAGRMRTNAVRVPDPATQQRSRLLMANVAQGRSQREADGAARESKSHARIRPRSGPRASRGPGGP